MRSRLLALIFAALMAAPAMAAAEPGPKAVIDTFCQRLTEVMKHADALGYEGRIEKLRPAITDAYDMAAMTTATLGVAAKKLSPEESASLAAAYSRYSVALYAEQFDGWDGETFKIEDAQPADKGLMLVKSWIVPKEGSPTEIDYLMHQNDGAWKIVDVLFDGMASQVALRRSQFVPIFRDQGAKGLISMLDDKAEAMGRK
jgi:phospholipid transport system substrate-binding protein